MQTINPIGYVDRPPDIIGSITGRTPSNMHHIGKFMNCLDETH